jgi:hypothetical protein
MIAHVVSISLCRGGIFFFRFYIKIQFQSSTALGWVDIGTRTKVPLKFVTYLLKVPKIAKKNFC